MKYLFTLLFLFLFTGCAMNNATIQIRYVGDDKGLCAAQAAAKEWKDVCGRNIYISRDHGDIIMMQVNDIREIVPSAPRYVSALTSFDPENGKPKAVLFQPFGSQEQLTGLIAHELGHVLGIKHVAFGLMKFDTSATPKYDDNGKLIISSTDAVITTDPNDLIVTSRECQELLEHHVY
jgi:hypothetical protein